MKDIKLTYQIIKITIFCLLFGVNVVLACSSGHGDIPICKSFSDADVVFVGQLTKLSEDATVSTSSLFVAKFDVETVYKGDLSKTVFIRIPVDSCGYEMKIKQTYFVYAAKSKYGNSLEIKSCGRTKLKSLAKMDIAYARNFKNRKFQQSILGNIRGLSVEEANNSEIEIFDGLQTRSLKVDNYGSFSLNSKFGKQFKVTVKFPLAVDIYVLGDSIGNIKTIDRKTRFEYDVSLKDGECDFRTIVIEKNLQALNMSISGTLNDERGSPLRQTKIYLYPKKPNQNFRYFDFKIAKTDDDGNFLIRPNSFGDYFLGINLGKTPELTLPYSQLFFSTIGITSEPKQLSVKINQQLSLGTIKLPTALNLRTIYGKLTFLNRNFFSNSTKNESYEHRFNVVIIDPIANSIYSSFDAYGKNTIKVNNDGNFSFVGYEGYEYIVEANGFDTNNVAIHSKPMKIRVLENTPPIEIKLTEIGVRK